MSGVKSVPSSTAVVSVAFEKELSSDRAGRSQKHRPPAQLSSVRAFHVAYDVETASYYSRAGRFRRWEGTSKPCQSNWRHAAVRRHRFATGS